MAQDPFPLTENKTLEERLRVVFTSLATLDTLPDDPTKPREGQIWLNKNTGKVRVFIGGQTKTLLLED